MNDIKHCETCGAPLRKRWVRLTIGMVQFLVKFKQYVIENNKNVIQVAKELKPSNIEYSDFQKLRFHALLAKYKEEGKHKIGYWVLTHRGSEFLKGEVRLPIKVCVFRNQIVGYSEETANVKEIIKSDIYWENQETIQMESASDEEIAMSKARSMKKVKKKKNKRYCPDDDTQMKLSLVDKINPNTGKVSIEKWWICPKCGHKDFDL